MAIQMHEPKGERLGRVLVVDDDPMVRQVVCRHLTKAGYEVVECADGEEGITAQKSGDNPLVVDAILCDIHMPKINGIEAIAYFREQFPCVPVLVLTGFPDVERAVTLMRQGVKDYLVKPVAKERLLEVVKKAVDGHIFEVSHAN